MWIGIILIVISCIFFILMGIVKNKERKEIFAWASMLAALVGGLLIGIWSGEKNTAIKCHEGNNPYVQIIRYEYEGDNLINQDTIYIKREDYEK